LLRAASRRRPSAAPGGAQSLQVRLDALMTANV
jgi:hypothetical protein